MPELFVGSSPHIGTKVRTRAIMARVLIALTPISLFGIAMYGINALCVIVVCIASAVAGETLFRLITKQPNRTLGKNRDLSAVVSGLMLALVLPPSVPLWMAALGALFATVVAKEFFGGLGANVFNPALAGRAFLMMSFPAAMTSWTKPTGFFAKAMETTETVAAATKGISLDSVSGATPLGIIKLGGGIIGVGHQFAAEGLVQGQDYFSTIRTLFFGWYSGTIGETSSLLILAACFYLLIAKIIDFRAPLAMAASTIILSLLLGIDPLFNVLAGGLLFGAVFMVTDYTTAPVTATGKWIFGAGVGTIAMLIRHWGNYPEGVMFAILIMNALTPFLNKLLQKKYGYGNSKNISHGGTAARRKV